MPSPKINSTKGVNGGGSEPAVPGDATRRSVQLWVGSTPDAAVPPRVRLRIWEREGGRCWISGRKIMAGDAWDLDHKIALCNGGSHSEDNLFPALRDKHREKTAADVAEKSKVDRIRKKSLGLWPKSNLGNRAMTRGFDGKVKPRKVRQFSPTRTA